MEVDYDSVVIKVIADDGSPSPKRSKSNRDPFPSRLRCERLQPGQSPKHTLWWYSPDRYIPLAAEQALIPVLLRWGASERKMMKDQPGFRLPQIKKKCHQHQVPLLAALSLRRHHIKRLNPYRSMEQLQLGNSENIRESADLFERAVEDALRKHNIAFYSEQEQKLHNAKRLPDEPYPPTPDFILKQPVLLRKYKDEHHHDHHRHRKHQKNRKILEERCIHCKSSHRFLSYSTECF